MNRRIPNGAYCVFRHPVEGTRQGRVVLVEHRDIHDSELGGSFTVKIWESEKEELEGDTWRHREVRLRPDTTAPGYDAIILREVLEGELRVAAELVEVLPAGPTV